jgi:3-phenylpropionate/trans-cinnamate dioxygenase ferredoxin component
MSFIDIFQVDQIPAGTMKSFTVNEKNILITNIDGKFYAIGGKCTHAGGDLSKGTLEGKIVTCPRHGSQFDVTTGKNLRGPKILIRFSTKDEPVYEVKIDGKNLQVQI